MGSGKKSSYTELHNIDQSILGHINDPVSVVDKHYIYRAVSKAYEQLFKKPAEAIIGHSVIDLHGEEIFHTVLKPSLDKALAGEEVEFQFSRPGPDGTPMHFHSKHTVYSGPLTDGPGVAVVARDITQQVKVQEALEKERCLLLNIINTLPNFVFAKDNLGVYQVTNHSFEQFLAKDAADILGKTDDQLMSSQSAAYIQSMDAQVLTTGLPVRCDEWVTYEDGRRRLLDMHKLPLVDENNNVSGVLGIGTNVTFERQAEQNREMASLFFEVTNNPCFVLDHNCRILTSNEAAKRTFSQAASLSQPITDLLFCTAGSIDNLNTFLSEHDYWHGEICSHDDRTFIAALHKVQGQSEQDDQFILIIQAPDDQQSITLELLEQAYQDPLTKLPNRRLFFSKLESAIVRAERQLNKLAVLYIDLDNFKPINDRYGHHTGDEALRQIAEILQSCFRKTDTFARLGGDEFAALVDINDWAEAHAIADKIRATLASTQLAEAPDHQIAASIGISCFPDDAVSAEALINKADEAMYSAKRRNQARPQSPAAKP